MKASHPALARMLVLISGAIATACVPVPEATPAPSPAPVEQAPEPEPEPVVTPEPAPVTAPAAVYENWIDAPRTEGRWTYGVVNGGTIARFGVDPAQPLFAVGCMGNSKRVVLIRYGMAGPLPDTFSVRTETADRELQPKHSQDERAISHALEARDSLLDAIALTRGRFAVETPQKPTLYLPAWAEVTRVIEDCR